MVDGGAAPVENYQPPVIVWLVEYTDDRQPGWRFQAGAFTTEVEARKLVRRLNKTGSYGDLSINMVPVHQTIQDWERDRRAVVRPTASLLKDPRADSGR